MNVTRSFNKYKATFFEVVTDLGKPEFAPCGEVEYMATTANRSTAIKELKATGFDVPKAAYITVEDLGKVTYQCTLDAFLSIAVPVTE